MIVILPLILNVCHEFSEVHFGLGLPVPLSEIFQTYMKFADRSVDEAYTIGALLPGGVNLASLCYCQQVTALALTRISINKAVRPRSWTRQVGDESKCQRSYCSEKSQIFTVRFLHTLRDSLERKS